MRIFLTHAPDMLANYYGDRALAALRRHGEVHLNETGRVLDDPAALAEAARGAQIVVADRRTPIPAEFLEAAPDLLAVCRVAVDIRNIDVAAAGAQGILVTRATPGFIPAVAELALGFMVDLARGVPNAVAAYRAGEAPAVRPGRQLRGATLGIIGYGVIGEYLAGLGLALGMTVLVSDPHRRVKEPGLRQVDLPALLGEADFVTCLAAATDATENLMDDGAFGRMKPGAYFLNLSRGNLVDEAALERALDSGRLAGAAMDVGRAPDQKPSPRLASRPDVVATPHIGGLTPQAVEHQAFDTVEQVGELVRGRMPAGAVNAAQAFRLERWLPRQK
jgi:D-3-phosphoglycerate dehydrogenase / 2-oxoglutarate reductase